MAKKLDKIVVVDIEATCWENKPEFQRIFKLHSLTLSKF